jgi:hypothetical protein
MTLGPLTCGSPTSPDETRLDPGEQRADGIIASRHPRPDARNARRVFGNAVGIEQRQPEFGFDPLFQSKVERRTGAVEAAEPSARQPVDSSHRLILQEALI